MVTWDHAADALEELADLPAPSERAGSRTTCECYPHGPDEPCTCPGCWACVGHVVGCTCDVNWDCEHRDP